MPDNPYTPPNTGREASQRKVQDRQSWMVLMVGLVSFATLAYAASVHALLLTSTLRGGANRLATLVSYPALAAMHFAVCLVGGVTAFCMLIHAVRNRRLLPGRRVLWGCAVATGYGMPFYWFFHLRSTTRNDGSHSPHS